MKIAFVGNSLKTMIIFRNSILSYLKEQGYEIVIIAPNDDANIVEINKQYKVIPINLSRKGANPIEDILTLIMLIKIYNNEKFDIIFHYTIKANIYGSIASAIVKTPSISVITGFGYIINNTNLISKLSQSLYRIALYFSNKIWFLNEDDQKEFIKRKIITNKKKAYVLPGEGIDTLAYYPEKKNKSEKTIFTMISRILWDKGFKEYVLAAKMIKEKYRNIEFNLIGPIDEGNPAKVDKKIIEHYAMQGIINYLGSAENVKPYIVESDCIILPSYREGIPRILLEAASMEKPIITTDVPGCKEVVKDNYNGFLCKAKCADDLAKKIEAFLRLSEYERNILGKNGRKLVLEKFDNKIVIKKYVQEIEIIENLNPYKKIK